MHKIACLLSARCSYFRQKLLLECLEKEDKIELTIMLTSGLLDEEHKETYEEIYDNFFTVDFACGRNDGGPIDMARATHRIIGEANTFLDDYKPDCVLLIADRFELIGVALSACCQGIPIAHIQGGELSGNIDGRIRHAVSQLADIHFPSHDYAKQKLKQMGLRDVYNYGCPSIDLIRKHGIKRTAVDAPYIIGIFHPHTLEHDKAGEQTQRVLEESLKFCKKYNYQLRWFLPNNDAGFTKVLDELAASEIVPVKNLTGEKFLRLLAGAKMIIGNSSAGIRESSYLAVPSVNIGDRQSNRLCANNVFCTDFDTIYDTMEYADSFEAKRSILFGNGNASKYIVNELKGFLNARRKNKTN